MVKTFFLLVAILLLHSTSFAVEVNENATLLHGVSMGYSNSKAQPIFIRTGDGNIFRGDAKNDSPMTERISIKILEQCDSNKTCVPAKGYVVDADGTVGVRAKTIISPHAQMYAMSSVVASNIAKALVDSNITSDAKEKMISYYRDLAEQAAPYMTIEAKTKVTLVIE